MSFDSETLQRQIPYYLTAAPEKEAFISELKALNEGAAKGYYLAQSVDPYIRTRLQGDGWQGFELFAFSAGERRTVRGIILSNSCDISVDNERSLPVKLTFAPIVRLSRLRDRFKERGLQDHQIDSKLRSIRSQNTTAMFYLPPGEALDDEYVVLLDDLHSMPTDAHPLSSQKLFTLSRAGFYLFVLKLSIHFCRFHENVDRAASV